MRASKNVRGQGPVGRGQAAEGRSKDLKPETRNLKPEEIHISGAEGLYEDKDISKIAGEYLKRALEHTRGRPDKIVLTFEKISHSPKAVRILPLSTLDCSSPDEAMCLILATLEKAGIAGKAINNAIKLLKSEETMRGAALIRAISGKRVETDKKRGVRVSRFGIDKATADKLSGPLFKSKRNKNTVKDALVLASKVAAGPGVIAEICISDDPEYTTGYIASGKTGYVRIPNIKKSGDMFGGRVFFVKEEADLEKLTDYLERVPVLIGGNVLLQ